MGTLFRPKGVCACGLARLAGRLRICGSGRFLGSLSDSICVDPEDLWLAPLGPPLLLEEVVVHGSAFLHPVQGLYVRGHARPRSIAVRAASRCSAPAHEVRSRVEPSFDGPRLCRRGQHAASRSTHRARRRQGSLAQQRQPRLPPRSPPRPECRSPSCGLPASGAWAGSARRCAEPGLDRCPRRRCLAGRTAS